MQYKIPVQIENDDKIVLNLSMKQLSILIIGGGIGYTIFKGLAINISTEVAAFPAIIIFLITAMIVFLNVSEMTFLPYMLNLIRQSINGGEKTWIKGVDSFQTLDIGYIAKQTEKVDKKTDTNEKIEKINELQEKLKNI